MKNLFEDTRILDGEARRRFHLTEEIMMENAGSGMEQAVLEKSPEKVLILCGGGNNGADGYVLARKLFSKCQLVVVSVKKARSELCILQSQRFSLCGGKIFKLKEFYEAFSENEDFDVIAECVFGSGFHGELDEETAGLFKKINGMKGYKIACDMPAGLSNSGECSENCFTADLTVSMGALKIGYYSDSAKDVVGKIINQDLGISRENYEAFNEEICGKVLEISDLKLPFREKQSVHKGNFGHCAVVAGEKLGAACIAGSGALASGAGLVTLVNASGFEKREENFFKVPFSLMMSGKFPEKVNSVVLGPGFGRSENIDIYVDWLLNHPEVKCVLDADCFYYEKILELLKKRPQGIILTPHPKEFANLLTMCGFVETVAECVKYRVQLVELFCRKFPDVVLLLKGANVLVGVFGKNSYGDLRGGYEKTSETENKVPESEFNFSLYINPHGTNALAKGGSGDVLSGLCGSFMAQGYDALSGAINGTLAHGIASAKVKNNFALTPEVLIETVQKL